MNAFTRLLSRPHSVQEARGYLHTAREIAQQPEVWPRVAELLDRRRGELRSFLREAGASGPQRAALVLTGAGSSEFIGNAIQHILRRRLDREVASWPTTHLVTHPGIAFQPERPCLVISFARSGNSPESLATWERVKRFSSRARQLVITCNASGELARLAAAEAGAFCLVLPEETNDRSLAMTSSFTSMALAGIGLSFLENPAELAEAAARLARAGRRVIEEHGDTLRRVALTRAAGKPFDRACYLGSGGLFGAMQEAALKMQELNAGRVAALHNSFLGIRHGPQVFIDGRCLVVAALAGEPGVRRYELDLLRELRAKGQGCGILGLCARADDEIRGLCDEIVDLDTPLEDDFRVLTDVAACQILALFASLRRRLRPDSPSAGGIIHRVVQGVTIYDP